MEAKEKAKELVNKFFNDLNTDQPDLTISRRECKQCALIAVDELIDQFTNKCCEHQNNKYWQQVKTEIQKL